MDPAADPAALVPLAHAGAAAAASAKDVYDLGHVFPGLPPARAGDPLGHVAVLRAWPGPDAETPMDASQLLALRTALTSNIALIQGPPGTGKTFTGLQVRGGGGQGGVGKGSDALLLDNLPPHLALPRR